MADNFNLGLKTLHRLCSEQNVLDYARSKLNSKLFKGGEIAAYNFVASHVDKYHVLPNITTLINAFPEVKEISTPEPTKYYVELLENKFFYETINTANLTSQDILKGNKDAWELALGELTRAKDTILMQKYRTKILDMGLEGPSMVLNEYHHLTGADTFKSEFGWDYLDKMGGVVAGDVVSFVGRPSMGKTWQMLYTALHNWRVLKQNVLFVSMEMSPLPIAQRVAAMYAGTNMDQLKSGGYSNQKSAGSSMSMYQKFVAGIKSLSNEQAKLYIVDGNLAACAEDVFALADQLKCRLVFIDGAYLLRHKNTKLDRFTRVAENIELIKRFITDLDQMFFGSWQFNRGASKDKKKGEKGTLDDIGYSDAIGQISSVVLGLFQEEGVETLEKRQIKVLKGRNGEIGQFDVNWDFVNMDFSGVDKAHSLVGAETYMEEPLSNL